MKNEGWAEKSDTFKIKNTPPLIEITIQIHWQNEQYN